MVIDSSAILAVMLGETHALRCEQAIVAATSRLISVASVLECSIVLTSRYGEAGELELDRLLRSVPMEIRPIDLEQLHIARGAFRHFGKGRHPAGLNFGDCFSYALSVQA